LQRSFLNLATLSSLSHFGKGTLSRRHARILVAVAANSEIVLYILLLNNDHAYSLA